MPLKELTNIKKDNPLNNKFNQFTKRVEDIFLSLLFIVVSLPLMLIIAFLVKISSKGSIFFTQERVTLNNKTFKMYKFRTMVEDAEVKTGPIFADHNDSRCTKIGLILRKLSLDELPQFFNVLIGDMSIVGPRPERPFYVEQLSQQISDYLDRHQVKTGMTGLAQIKGFRGKTSLELRVKNDLDYIYNWSLFSDLKIILGTFTILFVDLKEFLLNKINFNNSKKNIQNHKKT